MSLKLLDDCTRSFLRSGAAISCISQCVEELVLNSIDAGAQSITVHVDIPKLFMQVTDNGTGISYDDLQLLGERYATSKCHTVKDLDNLCFHGYRGEAVASIIDCCGVVEFSTKHCLSSNAYCKTFHHGRSLRVCPLRNGSSNIGTTVTIHDIFYNLPVRRKIISDVTEIEKARKTLSTIALVHPNVSLMLRNSQTSERLMQTKKTNSIIQSFELLFGSRLSLGLQQVHFEKHGFTVHGCISTNSHYTKSYQFIYLNKRYIKNTRLHARINQILSSSLLVHKLSKQMSDHDDQKHYTNMDSHGVFVLNIECSLNEYDITLEPAKTLVEFKRWDDVLSTIESLVMEFLSRNNLTTGIPSVPVEERQEDDVATSLLSQVTPQNTLEYGLRSRPAHRKGSLSDHVSFTMDSFDHNNLNCSTPDVSSCVSEGKENIRQLSVHDSRYVQPCKRRKVLTETTDSMRLSNEDCLSKSSVIQLNAPMRPSVTTSNMNPRQRTLLATAKRFGNRNYNPLEPENTRIPENQIIEKPSYLMKNKASIEETKKFQGNASDHMGDVFQDPSTKTMNTMSSMFPFSIPANKDNIPTNVHYSSNGRVVATTYSFITPLSRDHHMTTINRQLQATSNDERSHTVQAHDDHHTTQTFNTSNQPITNDINNSSSNDNRDSVSIDSLVYTNQDIFGNHTNSNLAFVQSAKSVTDSSINSADIVLPQTHNTAVINSTSGDSSYELFGYSPLRAAPHLTYGLGPLKPRAKVARRIPIEGAHGLQKLETTLPESKWRDKAEHVSSSIIYDWKNPALSAGNVDILNIGMSSGTSSSIKIHSIIHPYKFTKDIFNNLKVLGQVDCKFIACLLRPDSDNKTAINCAHHLLVFFDQHAVHERIRVEALSKDAYNSDKIKTIPVDPPRTIFLSESEKTLSIAYKHKLERTGIILSHDRGSVFVHAMPSVFDEIGLSEKRKRRSTSAMDLVQELVSKHLDHFCSGRSVCASIPPTIQRVLNSKACHGAIKFGDPLTLEECSELVMSLSLCKLPFQCAHGRPSLIPVLDLNQLKRRYPEQPLGNSVNIKKLREMCTKKN